MSANNSRLSPRQKMINLMYIVFLAMVAMNVSGDVLEGFKHVEDALDASNAGAQSRNQKLYQEFDLAQEKNPEKVSRWYTHAQEVRTSAEQLVGFIDSLKLEIVRNADGKDGDPNNIENRENLEAVNQVMLSPLGGKGPLLRKRLEAYKDQLVAFLPDADARVVANYLNTTTTGSGFASWENQMFEPTSRNVMRGSVYEAQIVMAAVDTTQTPSIYIGDKLYNPAKQGYYSVTAGREGIQTLQGYLEVDKPDGTTEKLPFESSYFVSEPVATVSNTMMNVMYAGIDNPLSISVPGVAAGQVSASMTNGTLTRTASGWVAKPKTVDQDAVITVTANQNGRTMTVSQTSFRVRRLPDPTPYLLCKDAAGNSVRYKGGTPISKQALLAAGGIRAAIDDGLLSVEFTVKSFRIDIFDSMGNDIPEDSQTSAYSERQRTAVSRLQRGKKFFITRVKAVGPDGIERTLSPIEVIVN